MFDATVSSYTYPMRTNLIIIIKVYLTLIYFQGITILHGIRLKDLTSLKWENKVEDFNYKSKKAITTYHNQDDQSKDKMS